MTVAGANTFPNHPMGQWALASLLQGTPEAIISQDVTFTDLPEPLCTWTAVAARGGLDAFRREIADLPDARQIERDLLRINPRRKPKAKSRETPTTAQEGTWNYSPLPAAVAQVQKQETAACAWLDDYVAFSKQWSPLGYEHFHEAVGLWVLSTVAARRVQLHFGKPRYTPLMLALVAHTSQWVKTTTAEIGVQFIKDTGLGWLLAADNATPAKFISDLSGKVPAGYGEMDDDQREWAKNRLALAGQRGWFYEEFGQHIASMSSDSGHMADFRGLVRRLDDCKDSYEYGTISRGSDIIERPYVPLLANMTPADMAPAAKRGASMWNDGYWARYAFVTPPADLEPPDGRFPKGQRVVPGQLLKRLRDWHDRLRMPKVIVTEDTGKDGQGAGTFRVHREPSEPETLILSPEAEDAYYAYFDALKKMARGLPGHDLDGNYTRFAEKALRVAMLTASLNGDDELGLVHWGKGQAVAERWRRDLHELFNQVNEREPSEEKQREDKLYTVLAKQVREHDGQAQTAADLRHYVRGLSTKEITSVMDGMVAGGVVCASTTRKGTRAYAPPAEASDQEQGGPSCAA